jgi:hypothetical protein
MRDGVLEHLDDADLAFAPGGNNVPFGQLIEEVAALEESYVHSLRDHVQQWPPSDPARQSPGSTSQLRERLGALDAAMEAAVVASSNDEDARITRPDGGIRTLDEQVEIYTQAMFIFLGKAVVYLRAMSKDLPQSVAHYIG